MDTARVETVINPNRVEDFLKAYDTDHDGSVARPSGRRPAANQEFFDKIDANKDGAPDAPGDPEPPARDAYQVATTETNVKVIRQVAAEAFGAALQQNLPHAFHLVKGGQEVPALHVAVAEDGKTPIDDPAGPRRQPQRPRRAGRQRGRRRCSSWTDVTPGHHAAGPAAAHPADALPAGLRRPAVQPHRGHRPDSPPGRGTRRSRCWSARPSQRRGQDPATWADLCRQGADAAGRGHAARRGHGGHELRPGHRRRDGPAGDRGAGAELGWRSSCTCGCGSARPGGVWRP